MADRQRPTQQRSAPEEDEPAPNQSVLTSTIANPHANISSRDSLFQHLSGGSWSGTHQHGRTVYDLMMRDTSVSGPFNLILSLLTSLDFEFRAQKADPSSREKEMVDFLNAQLVRLNLNGTYRDGWTKVINGFIGQGLQYGFSLAEISTKIANWRGRPYVQLDELRTLPQRSLDNSSMFELGATIEANNGNSTGFSTFNYDCFVFNDDAEVVGYVQNRKSDDESQWTGRETNRILHYTHGVGDGNPFGKSILWHAYYPWSDKYVAERLEQWKIENADSFLWMSYDADKPLPEVHNQVVEQISDSGDGIPFLSAPNSEWGTVSILSETYSEHVLERKDELRREISNGILVPRSLFSETGEGDVDTRNLIQVFLKFRFPAIVKEICEIITWQLGKRLIDANYTNVEPQQYPVCRTQIKLDNDLRVMNSLLQQLIPYLDADRLGEFAEDMLPGMQREWFPEDHEDSVHVQRPVGEHEEEPHGHDTGTDVGDSDATPPPGEPGETRQRTDGQQENVGQVTDTAAEHAD
jgi:hypothetical protein